MLKSKSVVSRDAMPRVCTQWSVVSGRSRRLCGLLLATVCLVFAGACRRDMQDQPKFRPYKEAAFFDDKLSTRPLVAGTVARGQLYSDVALYTGKIEGAATGGTNEFTGYNDKFPFPITEEVLNRGQERYTIFCSSCHSPLGDGNGMIARRGFAGIKSYHDDRLRGAPVGYIFDVITNGFGKMQAYHHQIPAASDRWAIVAYVRALQAAQPGTVPTANQTGAVNAQPAASPAASPRPATTTATPNTGGNSAARPATTPAGGNK